jgi:hypothetical protein
MKNIYRLAVVVRIIDCRKKEKNSAYVEINDIGYLAKNYDRLEDLSGESLRKNPTMLRVYDFFSMAESFAEAINNFHNTCPGAKFGKDPAFFLDRKRCVMKIDCPRIHYNSREQIICGQEVQLMPVKTGKFGFCFLQGRGPTQQNCEIKNIISAVDADKNYPKRIIKVGGRKYRITEVQIP